MSDKIVIVTGASSGIGTHIARRLVGDGESVVVTARRSERIEALANDLSHEPGRIIPITADVTDSVDVTRLVATTIDAFGGIDALVNNAGIEVQGDIETLDRSDLDLMMNTNLVGPYLCTRAALPHLRQREGSVVNIGSTVVARPPLHRFGYVASKAALEAMSRALAGDFGPDRVRVNVIRPGIVPSELRGATEAEESETLRERVPRLQAHPGVGSGTDIAAMVAFLISDEARWITGSVFDVDGGYSLGTPR